MKFWSISFLLQILLPLGVAAQRLRRPSQVAPSRERKLAVAEYSIPAFAVSFRSPNYLQGDAREDLALLGSTVAGPLRDVFREFVYESFRIQTARLANDPSLPEMVRQLTLVDFDVSVVHSESNKDENHQLRYLQEGWFEFYAEFIGAAHFIEPVDPADKPEDAYMEQLLGSWRKQYMVEDFSILQSMLRESEEPILQNHDYLEIIDDIQPGDFPFESYTPGLGMENSQTTQTRSFLEKFLISLVAVVGAATLAAVLLLARPYVAKYNSNSFAPHQGAFPTATGVSLPGREEDPTSLEESDRWLKQHRPDLFRALQRSSSYRDNPNGKDGIMNDSGSTRSNPLQFLYGGMFVRRNQEEPLPSVSLASCDSESMDPGMDELHDSGPTWWQKLAQSLHGNTLACDEDPSQYDFAFSDFPRHDGTPCLIFSETETGPVLMRVSMPNSPSQPLSNEDFQLQLSMHGANNVDDEGSVGDDDQDGDPEFTAKLERLIAMRHRHYEKERIIQKGRQARENERRKAEEEARRRDLKLRRHEMEIDVEQIEAELTPRALSRNSQSSQNPFESGMERRKSHRITSSDPDYFAAIQAASGISVESGKTTIGGGLGKRTLGGPSLRRDMEDDRMPPHQASWHTRNYSDGSPRNLGSIEPNAVSSSSPAKHRRSHRRSFSHGTEDMEENKPNGVARTRTSSSADDVMTFGIAAYTNFT